MTELGRAPQDVLDFMSDAFNLVDATSWFEPPAQEGIPWRIFFQNGQQEVEAGWVEGEAHWTVAEVWSKESEILEREEALEKVVALLE